MLQICFYLKWINPGWARVPLEVGPEAEVPQICLRQWLIWFIVQLVEPPRERDSSYWGLDIGVCCCIWSSVKGVRLPQVGEEREGGEWRALRGHSHSPRAVWPHWGLESCVLPQETWGTMQGVEQRGGVVGMTFGQGCEASSMQNRMRLGKDGKRKISWKASWIIQEKDGRLSGAPAGGQILCLQSRFG